MEAQLGQRLFTVFDGVHREALEGEELRENFANHSFVVDDKDPRGIFAGRYSHVSSVTWSAGPWAPSDPSTRPRGRYLCRPALECGASCRAASSRSPSRSPPYPSRIRRARGDRLAAWGTARTSHP